LSGLFFVISALLMVAVELVQTARGRSSLQRWRFVGRQAGIAANIVFFTIAALWALELSLPGDPRELSVGVPGTDQGPRPALAETASVPASMLPLTAAPVLGTLVLLALVLFLTQTLRLILRPAKAGLAEREMDGSPERVPG
jgi:hypothetical protein